LGKAVGQEVLSFQRRDAPLEISSRMHQQMRVWHSGKRDRDQSGGGPSKTHSLSLSLFQNRILGSGGSRAFAGISSRTLGRYVAVTNPTPPRCRSNGFQRVSVALQTTPEEPRQRNGPLGAPKRRPDPPHSRHPTRPGSCAAETTALGHTGAHLGRLPGGGAPTAGAQCPDAQSLPLRRYPGPPFPTVARPSGTVYAIDEAPGLPSYEK
jgi:hypothetical protein